MAEWTSATWTKGAGGVTQSVSADGGGVVCRETAAHDPGAGSESRCSVIAWLERDPDGSSCRSLILSTFGGEVVTHIDVVQLIAVTAHAPFSQQTLDALVAALDDRRYATEHRELVDPYSDAAEGLERRYVSDLAAAALALHGATATLPMCFAARSVGSVTLDRFLDEVGVSALAALPVATLEAATEALTTAFPEPASAPRGLAALRWLVARRGAALDDEMLLEHPSPSERARACERIAAAMGTPARALLLRFAVQEEHAAPACAAVSAAMRLIAPDSVLGDAESADLVRLLDDSNIAAAWTDLCHALRSMQAQVRAAAPALARHAVRPCRDIHDAETRDRGFAAARALARITPLPDEARAILDAATSDGDATVPYRVKAARGA
ncbi:MAG: hypothetical protein IPI67_37505 [Myxococcales bacterium]|nr:hypothetical protein [Myxococcales bacterium]